MSGIVRVATAIGAVGAATAAGALFTFSSFTIRGLGRLPPSQGAAAMQAINRAAPAPPFMIILFGTGAVCVALGLHAATDLGDHGSPHRLVAGACYAIGVIGLTVGYHVPRNDRLAALDATSAEGIAYWATYLEEWVRMNHVRTVAGLATSALLTASLMGE